MDPLTMMQIAGTATQLFGAVRGLQGAGDSDAVSRANTDLAFRNYYLNRAMQEQQLRMAQAGQIDARGNSVEYVPGVGWVERTTEPTRGLIQAEDTENLRRLTNDAIRSRLQRSNQFDRAGRDAAAGDAILASMQEGAQSVDDLRSGLGRAGVARAVSGGNNARRVLNLNSLRGGAGSEALASVARNNVLDTRSALEEARVSAPGEAANRRGSRVAGAVQPYSTLTRGVYAGNDGPASTSSLADTLAKRSSGANQSGAFLMSRTGGLSFTPPQQQRNDSATAIGGIGSAISNMGNAPWMKNLLGFMTNRSAPVQGNMYPEQTY